MIAACTERFERRLVEEVSGFRVQIVHLESSLRQQMTEMRAELRGEMANLGSGLRDEIAAGRIELFKWCFLFWIGQVVALGGLLAVILRLTR